MPQNQALKQATNGTKKYKEGDYMANISQNVNIEMLEKLPDGTYKRKYPKTRADDGTTFDEHLADYATFKNSKGQPNGLTELDNDGIVKTEQLPNSIWREIQTITLNNNVSELNISIPSIYEEIRISSKNLSLSASGRLDIYINNVNDKVFRYLTIGDGGVVQQSSLESNFRVTPNTINTGEFVVVDLLFRKGNGSLNVYANATNQSGTLRGIVHGNANTSLQNVIIRNNLSANTKFEVWGR